MADTKIRFSIGSIFTGEGFKKAEAAIKSTSAQAKKAQGALSAVAGQMGEFGGAAGKVAGVAGNVAGAFKEMGAAGGIAAAAVIGMNLVLDHMKAELDAMAKAAADAAAAQEKAANKVFAEHLERVAASLREVKVFATESAKAFEEMAANAAKIESAKAGTVGASFTQKIAKMEWDAALERMAADDEATKKLVEAKWKVAIQREKEAAANAQATAAEEAAEKANETAIHREAMAADKVALAKEALSLAQKEETLAVSANKEKAKAFTKAREDAEKVLRDAESEHAKAIAEVTVSEEALKQATAKAEATRLSGQTATAELEAAERDLKAASEAEAKAREEKARRLAEGEREADELRKEETRITAAGKEKIKSIVDAIEKQTELIRDIKDIQKATQDGMEADARHTTGAFGPYKYHTNADGNVDDFEDFQRAQRFAGRAERDRQANERHNENLRKQMDKIREKGDHATDSEKKRLRDWDKMQKQLKDAQEEEAKKRKLEAEKDKLEKQLYSDVTEIRKKINAALAVK